MRPGRFVFRLLLAGVLSGGAYFVWVSTVGSPSPADLLPAGAFAVVEVRDAEKLTHQLSGTRFAPAFAKSATRALLERTATVKAFDAVLSEVERISGVSPGRGSAYDLLGAEAAIGWYPAAGGDSVAAPWVAGGRLSVRAWIVATTMRISRRFGLGATSVTQEQIAGRVLYSFPGSAGQSLHLFLAGRVLVGGSDRSLVVQAARAAGEAGTNLSREPAFQAIRGALPPHGELFVWLRDRSAISDAQLAKQNGRGSVGTRLRAGKTIEIDIVAEPVSARPAVGTAGSAAKPLPGIALLSQSPLFFLASREPVPAALTDQLQARRRAVARHGTSTAAGAAIQPGSGYAVAITDSDVGPGFFPAPRGLVVIGMASAAEAANALPLLFPPGARTATAGGTRALATRESFPLAGGFDLWGAAVGPQLVFATDTALIAAAADAGSGATSNPGDPSWRVGTVAAISMEKLLPLLLRWGAPLSGLVAANWPAAPDILRDLDLLGAVGTVRVAAGHDDHFDRAAISITVHDLR